MNILSRLGVVAFVLVLGGCLQANPTYLRQPNLRPMFGLEEGLRQSPEMIAADENAASNTVIALFERSLAGHDVQASAYGDFGLYFSKIGQHERALPYLRKAVAVAPDFPDFHENLIATLVKLKRQDETCRAAKDARDHAVPMPDGFYALVSEGCP